MLIAPPSTLASRLSSLALCLPVCLWSVLSVSLTLPSNLSWVSISPLAVPAPSGVPALPSPHPASRGSPHSSFSFYHSCWPPGWDQPSCSSLVVTGDPAPALMSVAFRLCILRHQLLRDQLPPSLPAAHLPFISSFSLQACLVFIYTYIFFLI